MQAGQSTARQARTRHRHELRTLTYVTLDQANGGIVRNLTSSGIAVQAVAAVRPRQQIRVRFELRYPQLRVEARGEVVWSTFSGQCGIRFLDLSPRMARQIDEWIMGSLLEGTLLYPASEESLLSAPSAPAAPAQPMTEQSDGLMISSSPLRVIELPVRPEAQQPMPAVASLAETLAEAALAAAALAEPALTEAAPAAPDDLDWLSEPLSGRGLAWTVNTLVVVAALLLFALVFLSVTREMPKWPFAMTSGAAVAVAMLYWGFFKLFVGASPGAWLARLADSEIENSERAAEDRFR